MPLCRVGVHCHPFGSDYCPLTSAQIWGGGSKGRNSEVSKGLKSRCFEIRDGAKKVTQTIFSEAVVDDNRYL